MVMDDRIGMTNEQPKVQRRNINNIPDEDYREARVNAIRQGKSVGEYIADAIREKNDRERKGK